MLGDAKVLAHALFGYGYKDEPPTPHRGKGNKIAQIRRFDNKQTLLYEDTWSRWH